MRRVIQLGVLLAATALLVPLSMPSARACSCAGFGDLREAIDQSQAAFVGSLIEKRSAGEGEFGLGDAIYVFEVERWVKGDLGDVIEVRSPSQGSACGFEFFDGERIGAFLRLEGGELHSGLCSQVDPDVLLAAADGPEMSPTGLPHLLVGEGWNSPGLLVLDTEGRLVTELGSDRASDFEGTRGFRMCPGEEVMVQWTPTRLQVWELADLEVIASHDISVFDGVTWVGDVSCRDVRADSIWLIAASEDGAEGLLYQVVPELAELRTLPLPMGRLGRNHAVLWDDRLTDYRLVDLESGNEMVLIDIAPNENRGIQVAPHPDRALTAVVETRYSGEADVPPESSLAILDSEAGEIFTHPIPDEAAQVFWLGSNRVMVIAYQWEPVEATTAFVFDMETGESIEIPGWRGAHVAPDQGAMYAVDAGTVYRYDIETGARSELTTLPSESAGPIVVIEGAEAVPPTGTAGSPTVPGPTTPPLGPDDLPESISEPEDGVAIDWGPSEGDPLARIIFLGSLVIISLVVTWAVRKDQEGPLSGQGDQIE